MRWGKQNPWGLGGQWGLGGDVEECELVEERVLVQMDDTPGNRQFRDLLCIFAEKHAEYNRVVRQIGGSFDLNQAVGEQLDIVGSILTLPRQGFDDTRYRQFLQILVDLLLSIEKRSAQTGIIAADDVLRAIRNFVGDATPPIILVPRPPYHFELVIPGVDFNEVKILINFICRAVRLGENGIVQFTYDDQSLWNADTYSVTDGGIWCADTYTIPDCATWGLVIEVNSRSC